MHAVNKARAAIILFQFLGRLREVKIFDITSTITIRLELEAIRNDKDLLAKVYYYLEYRKEMYILQNRT